MIVLAGESTMFTFYGRVHYVIDDEHVVVVCCGKRYQKFHIDNLRATGYTGLKTKGGNLTMTSLKNLLRKARYYNPDLEVTDYDPA